MSLEIRPALPDDAPALSDLLQESRSYKESLGDFIWSDSDFSVEGVEASIERGGPRVALIEGQLVGSYTLLWEDSYFWGEMGQDQQAGYLHRLARLGSFVGLGAKLVDAAAQEVIDNNRSFLRLDFATDNEGLRGFYAGLGFQAVRNVVLEATQTRPKYRASLFQKTL